MRAVDIRGRARRWLRLAVSPLRKVLVVLAAPLLVVGVVFAVGSGAYDPKTGADLTAANLTAVDLTDYLLDADLLDADLTAANLSGVRGLFQDQLDDACGESVKGLDPWLKFHPKPCPPWPPS